MLLLQIVAALCAHRNQHILFSASRLWRVPVRSHLKHLAAPSASLAVQSAGRSKAVTDLREMSFLTPQGSRRRSTFYDENLGEVVDLSEHCTRANANLCEIIQDLVDALFPSSGHVGWTRGALCSPLDLCRRLPREGHQTRRKGTQCNRGNSHVVV